MSFPIAFTATIVNGLSYLFYADEKGGIHVYRQDKTDPTDSNPNKNYQTSEVNMSKGPAPRVDNKNPALSAVSYTYGGFTQIRLYFRDPNGYLREVCWQGGSSDDTLNFFEGELSDKGMQTEPGTLIAGSVNPSTTQLKVFCVRDQTKRPMLWYTPLASTGQRAEWKDRTITSS